MGESNGTREIHSHGDMDARGRTVVAFSSEFKPVDHPPEPNMDNPVKCPNPDPSLSKAHTKEGGIWKEFLAAESLRKKNAEPVAYEHCFLRRTRLPAAERRHPSRGQDLIEPSSLRHKKSKFSQFFQQCRELDC